MASSSILSHHFPIHTSLQTHFPNPLLSLPTNLSFLSLNRPQQTQPRKALIIRNGGGPRTYPGGVSKWQWKRMQAKKAKQLLKARLCRERQIYEMRKRAELKMAVSELERPWEAVETLVAPTLFSVRTDEQVKVLADRFQKAGGFDMWSERDGPRLFGGEKEEEGLLPSGRFFPKGVVHSVKPYAKFEDSGGTGGGLFGSGGGEERRIEGGSGFRRRGRKKELGGQLESGGDGGLLKLPVESRESGGIKDGSLGGNGLRTGESGNGRKEGYWSGDGARMDRRGNGRKEGVMRENGARKEWSGNGRKEGLLSGNGASMEGSGYGGSGRRVRSEEVGTGRERRWKSEMSGGGREGRGGVEEQEKGVRRGGRGQWEQLGDENDRRQWSERSSGGRLEKIGIERGWRGRSEQMGAGRGQRGHSEEVGVGREQGEQRIVRRNGQNEGRRSYGSRKSAGQKSDVYDMSLQRDGSYGY